MLAGVGVLVVFVSEVARQTIRRTEARVGEREAQSAEAIRKSAAIGQEERDPAANG